MKRLLIILSTIFSTVPTVCLVSSRAEESILQLEVNAPYPRSGGDTFILLDQELTGAVADSGDLLRRVPGVDAGRMGGHGLEPVIQGQQQSQLSVTSDGAFIHGGCPNRMDPPSSISNLHLYDSMIVSRGYTTVTTGPGGSGGGLQWRRHIPEASRVAASTEFISNGSISNSVLDLATRRKAVFARLTSQVSDAGNYQAGGGDIIRGAFKQYSGIFDLGYAPDEDRYVRFSIQATDVKDALFAGAGMDAPSTELLSPKIEALIPVGLGLLQSVEVRAYGSLVDHVMDNFSLRAQAGMSMRTEATSDTYGGSIVGNFQSGDSVFKLGVDHQSLARRATRFVVKKDSGNVMPNGFLWPEINIVSTGLFGEYERRLSKRDILTVGTRLDAEHAASQLTDQRTSPTAKTAEDLYELYYRRGYEPSTTVNPSGLVRYERQIQESLTGYVTLSYVTRNPDSTERFLASESMAGNWVGNPELSAEQHRQVQVGGRATTENVETEILAFYNSVEDYILRDVAKGQSGIYVSDGASVYRNTKAILSGVTLTTATPQRKPFRLSNSLTYTYGRDDETNRPLPQIPALSGITSLVYGDDRFSAGVHARYALKQTRVDDDRVTGTGRDRSSTAGYVVLDLIGSYQLAPGYELHAGVTNLGDIGYANHLNRSNGFEAEEIRIDEPGRSLYLSLNATF